MKMGTTSGEPGQGANLAPALTTRPCSNHPAFPVLSTLGGARREVDGDEGAQRREVITGQQIRAARELLGWTPYRLAPRAGIGHTLLRQFEAGAKVPDEESAARLKAALEEAGVIFTAGRVKLGRSLRGGRVPEQLNAEKDG